MNFSITFWQVISYAIVNVFYFLGDGFWVVKGFFFGVYVIFYQKNSTSRRKLTLDCDMKDTYNAHTEKDLRIFYNVPNTPREEIQIYFRKTLFMGGKWKTSKTNKR